jgi:Glyoxal oxidase N-terminus
MENNNIRLDNDPHKVGKWEKAFESRVVGIHTSLLHNGKVLFFTYPSKENHHHNHANNNNVHSHGSAERTGDSEVLDPITKESKKIALERNIFCGGACFLEDGNLFVAGGQYQTIYSFFDPPSRDIHTFNTAEEKWIHLKDNETNKFMEMKARWYPTCLTLADGKVLIISGRYIFMQLIFGFLGLLIIHFKFLIQKIFRYNLHKIFHLKSNFILLCIYCRQEGFLYIPVQEVTI